MATAGTNDRSMRSIVANFPPIAGALFFSVVSCVLFIIAGDDVTTDLDDYANATFALAIGLTIGSLLVSALCFVWRADSRLTAPALLWTLLISLTIAVGGMTYHQATMPEPDYGNVGVSSGSESATVPVPETDPEAK